MTCGREVSCGALGAVGCGQKPELGRGEARALAIKPPTRPVARAATAAHAVGTPIAHGTLVAYRPGPVPSSALNTRRPRPASTARGALGCTHREGSIGKRCRVWHSPDGTWNKATWWTGKDHTTESQTTNNNTNTKKTQQTAAHMACTMYRIALQQITALAQCRQRNAHRNALDDDETRMERNTIWRNKA